MFAFVNEGRILITESHPRLSLALIVIAFSIAVLYIGSNF